MIYLLFHLILQKWLLTRRQVDNKKWSFTSLLSSTSLDVVSLFSPPLSHRSKDSKGTEEVARSNACWTKYVNYEIKSQNWEILTQTSGKSRKWWKQHPSLGRVLILAVTFLALRSLQYFSYKIKENALIFAYGLLYISPFY